MLGKTTQDRPVPAGPLEPAERPAAGGEPWAPSLPAACLRTLSTPDSPRTGCAGPSCPGWQRENRCIGDVVRAANERGVEWRFEIDPEGFWVYQEPEDVELLVDPRWPEDGPGVLEVFDREPLGDMVVDEERRQALTAQPGTVAVTADEAGRFTQFAVSMQGLQLPAGSRTLWQVGNDIAGNRNAAVEALLEGAGEWLWFIDDDHAFSPDILLRLLAHGLPIIAPLVLRRVSPFDTVAAIDDGVARLTDLPRDALVRVQATGSSGMLIRRAVLERVDPPWFELGNGVSEDVAFCLKAAEAGIPIFVDTAVPLGHLTTCGLWPVWSDELGRYVNGFSIADGFQLEADITVATATA